MQKALYIKLCLTLTYESGNENCFIEDKHTIKIEF